MSAMQADYYCCHVCRKYYPRDPVPPFYHFADDHTGIIIPQWCFVRLLRPQLVIDMTVP